MRTIENNIPILDPLWARNAHILAGRQKSKFYAIDATDEGKLIGVSKFGYSLSILKGLSTLNLASLYNPDLRVIKAIDKTLDEVNAHLERLDRYITDNLPMDEECIKACKKQLYITPQRAMYKVEALRKEALLGLGKKKEYLYDPFGGPFQDESINYATIDAKKQKIVDSYLSVLTKLSNMI